VHGLRRVADDEDDGVPAGDGEHVLVLVVVDESDELLELVEVEVGLPLLVRELDVGGLRRHRVSHGSRVTSTSEVVNRTPAG
jgi:hypothetical protein